MMNGNDDAIITNYSNQHLGNYRLLHLLGRGGYASVYLGEHVYLKRLAAIKVLRTVLNESEKARFIDEARLLAGLSHPHIVRVHDFDVLESKTRALSDLAEKSIPFLIMDFMPGGSLRSHYPGGSSLFLETVVDYIKQVAVPLQYAHDQGIIHRDIKPENLLLNEQQEVMISDFGLALFAPTPEVLSLQEIVGSLPYSAPEQLRGRPHFASDQYSLGIIAYEWLCGHRPFRGEEIEMVMQHISSAPPSLLEQVPTLPPAVEEVILQALEKTPQQRFPHVIAFAEALQQASQTQSFGFSSHLPIISREWPHVSSSSTLSQDETPVVEQGIGTTPMANEYATLISSTGEREPRKKDRPISPAMQKNRVRMIRKVRSFWIHGVLERTLDMTRPITLGLDEVLDAVTPSRQPYQEKRRSQPLAPGIPITQVYDQMEGKMLILGENGSGKTTLLLQLARDLLDRAERQETSAIPVIFPLSSWSKQRLPLTLWLIEELQSKYQVPRALGKQWIDEEMLVLLLDGLDEVEPHERPACIAAINTHRKTHPFNPLVVCTQERDYMLNSQRVLLRSAISIQPLTTTQAEHYLLDMGKELEAVSRLLQNDQLIQKLITTPLMLNMVVEAFRERTPNDSLALQLSGQQQIIEIYVEAMLSRDMTKGYTPQEMIRQLSILAKHVQQQHQTIFYLDQLQPDWIDQLPWRLVYNWLTISLPGIGIGLLMEVLIYTLLIGSGVIRPPIMDGLFGPLIGYLLSQKIIHRSFIEDEEETQEVAQQPIFKIGDLLTGLLCGFFAWQLSGDQEQGVIYGMLSLILSIVLTLPAKKRTTITTDRITIAKKSNPYGRLHTLFEQVKTGMFVGVAYGWTAAVLVGIRYSSLTHINGMISLISSIGLHAGLGNGLLGALTSFFLLKHDRTIHPTEIISWSWSAFLDGCRNLRNIFNTVLVGCIAIPIDSFLSVFRSGVMPPKDIYVRLLTTGVANGLLTAVSAYLLGAIVQAATNHNLADQDRSRPNEGIRRSLRYGLQASIVGACIGTFFYVLAITLPIVSNTLFSTHHDQLLKAVLSGWSTSLTWQNDLFIGFIVAALMLLLFGGWTFLQHSILRLILWRTKILPLNTPRLLDHAASHLLLHKIGGGYMFVHHLLQEYFTSLDEKQD